MYVPTTYMYIIKLIDSFKAFSINLGQYRTVLTSVICKQEITKRSKTGKKRLENPKLISSVENNKNGENLYDVFVHSFHNNESTLPQT